MSQGPSKARNEGRIGKLPPRYRFMLNPFPVARLSRCPKCDKLTYPRKFPLLVHVEGCLPYVQAKTCKYCSRCELIMCQQNELEEQLAHAFRQRRPDLIGNDYLVLGTVAMQVWERGMHGDAPGLAEAMEYVALFKGYDDLQYDPGGWRLPGAPPRYLDPVPPDTSWRRGRRSRLNGTGR